MVKQAVVYNVGKDFKQIEACRLAVDESGTVAVVGDKDIEGCGEFILGRYIQDRKTGKKLYPQDGEAFIDSLPFSYHGTLCRVSVVDVDVDETADDADAPTLAESPEKRLKSAVVGMWEGGEYP